MISIYEILKYETLHFCNSEFLLENFKLLSLIAESVSEPVKG